MTRYEINSEGEMVPYHDGDWKKHTNCNWTEIGIDYETKGWKSRHGELTQDNWKEIDGRFCPYCGGAIVKMVQGPRGLEVEE